MSEVSDSGGKGRRAVSADLNLVPFIDLMSVLITFLLITAVWTQISMMQIGSSIYGRKSEDEPPPEIKPETQVVLRFDILETGYRVQFENNKYFVPKIGDVYDAERVAGFLLLVKEKYPNKEDAVISMEDQLPYEHLIQAMDVLLKAQFPKISVSTGGPS